MKILVVEDEHKIANALKRGLEQERYSVEVAYDGEDGLTAAEVDDYDLLILDRMLPGVDGLEICRRRRAAGDRTPILILTAKDMVRDRVAGLDAGADDYLVKPFAFEELLARIRALLRRPSGGQAAELKVGDLTLDPANFSVRREEKSIQLTAKEFALLEYLMRNVGRVVSKDTIVQHVWEYDADILPNTVEVYMGYLRNKVDKPFTPKLLHTVRGFGYKIEAVST